MVCKKSGDLLRKQDHPEDDYHRRPQQYLSHDSAFDRALLSPPLLPESEPD
jgi:hypothetical protein